MTMPAIAAANTPTMSSREIAELTGRRHDNVMRDIRAMLTELHGENDALKFEGVYQGGNGEARPCFYLPKRETLILVSGYSVTMRARIIDRWQELEQQARETPKPMHITFKIAAQEQILQLLANIDENEDQGQRMIMHSMADDLCRNMGYPTPPLRGSDPQAALPAPAKSAKPARPMKQEGKHNVQPLFLTPEQVSARYGGIALRTLANWRCQKQGPDYIKIGGHVRYPLAALLKWEKATRH